MTFSYFLFLSFFVVEAAILMSTSLVAVFNSEITALAILPAFSFLLSVSAGFMIKLDDLPSYWHWLSYLSFQRWGFEGLVVNEFQQYDTDDAPSDSQENGYGDVVSDYCFGGFNKDNAFGIIFITFVVFVGLIFYGMLPARSKLVRAADFDELSRGSDTSAGPDTLYMKYRRKVTSSISQKNSVGHRAPTPDKPYNNVLPGSGKAIEVKSGLHVPLVDEEHSDAFAAAAAAATGVSQSEPQLTYKPRSTVESFKRSSGVVETVVQCSLEFRDVQYTVPPANTDGWFSMLHRPTRGSANDSYRKIPAEKDSPSNKDLILLRGVTGAVFGGELCALMGPSGCGKSTLLDVLAQRKTVGTVSGEISYSGHWSLPESAYVMQDNVHLTKLTVRECLYFAAELRMSKAESKEAKKLRVEKIISMLELGLVAETVVGDELVRGLSGGQLKRLSIGVELVTLPALMFLDEPTTGLDSTSALEVMHAVRNLANQNRTIITTIHQPSDDIFELFDKVLLLAEGGRVIYFGASTKAAHFFTHSPYEYTLQEGENPSDFLINIAGSTLPAANGRIMRGGELAAYYVTTEHFIQSRQRYDDNVKNPKANVSAPASSGGSALNPAKSSKISWGDFGYSLNILVRRRYVLEFKNPRLVRGRIIRDLIMGVLLGSLYWQLDTGDSCDRNCETERANMLYLCAMSMCIGHLETMAIVRDERPVFYRERGAKAYTTLAYWMSIWAVQIPLFFLNAVFFSVPVYLMSNLRPGFGHFVVFLMFMALASYCSKALALLASSISQSTTEAMCYFPALFMFNSMYAGFLVRIPSMPLWQRAWLPCISFFRYVFQGIVLNEYQDNSRLNNAHAYIDAFGFDFISVEGCAFLLCLILAIYMLAFYLALKYVNFENR
jgi:ABC-type multidrug transport system ATPase subunit